MQTGEYLPLSGAGGKVAGGIGLFLAQRHPRPVSVRIEKHHPG